MTQWFYSAATGGFYLDIVHGDDMPGDCRAISDDLHDRLIEGQSQGKIIRPCPENVAKLEDPEVTAEDIDAAVDAARQEAYANEADPLFFKAQRGEASMEEWKAKVDEIKARYPAGELPQAQGDQAEQHANETTTDAP